MECQQWDVKATVQEHVHWQKAPVDGPLEEELSSQVEWPAYVGCWVFQEERGTKSNLSKTTHTNVVVEVRMAKSAV